MGKWQSSDRKGRTPKSNIEMWGGIERAIDPGLIELKRPCDIRGMMSGISKIGEFYDLVFTITMKSCPADLGVFARENGFVLMMDNQPM